MKLHLSGSQSRALALLLLLLAIAAVVAAVAVPTWLLHQRYDGLLEDYTDRLQRYRRVAALRPAVEQAMKDVETRGGSQYYLKATSPALASAELQGLVTRIVEGHGGKLMSTQMLPTSEDNGGAPPKASMSVQMRATVPSLREILHKLETGHPYLFVEQLTVRGAQGRRYKPIPGTEPEFIVQITVSGYAPAAGGKS